LSSFVVRGAELRRGAGEVLRGRAGVSSSVTSGSLTCSAPGGAPHARPVVELLTHSGRHSSATAPEAELQPPRLLAARSGWHA
jgi:hypothetical protein